MYVYKKTEPQLWTVGFYTPSNEWMTDSDHDSKEEAAKRVVYLNGGKSTTYKCVMCGYSVTQINTEGCVTGETEFKHE